MLIFLLMKAGPLFVKFMKKVAFEDHDWNDAFEVFVRIAYATFTNTQKTETVKITEATSFPSVLKKARSRK